MLYRKGLCLNTAKCCLISVMCYRSVAIKLTLATLLFSFISLSAYPAEWSNLPTYPGAKNKEEHLLVKDGAKQLNFDVQAVYPSKAVLEFYINNLSKNWNVCKEKDDWESFAVASGKSPLFVHQIVQHWVNYQMNRFLVVAVKYESPGIEFRKTPSTDIQKVFVVEYKEKDLKRMLSSLGLKC